MFDYPMAKELILEGEGAIYLDGHGSVTQVGNQLVSSNDQPTTTSNS
jgi:hypothetical protein